MTVITGVQVVHSDPSPAHDYLCGLSIPGRGGVLPYVGYIGVCAPRGYGFPAVLVINRV